MRLLFVGDLAPTGFGSVTTDLGLALLGMGVDVRFLSQNDVGPALPEPFRSRSADIAFYEFQASAAGVTGVRSLIADIIHGIPGHRLVSGEDFGDWHPDVVLLLGDFMAVRLLHARFGSALDSVPTWHYVPVEGVDLPPLWGELWTRLRPIAMSRFGQSEIARVTGTTPPLAYHGVDTSVFYPVSPSRPLTVPLDDTPGARQVTLQSREACKRFFGLDSQRQVILRTDRNMPRKRYGAMLRALGPLLAEREDTQLLIHARSYDQGGFLPDDMSKLPAAAQGRIIVTDKPGLPREVLAALYNAADLYVSTSAEGFGLTIAESIACGVPAVGLAYSAVPEVIGPAGVTVDVAHLYDNEYNHSWAAPDEDQLREAVRYLLDHPARRRALGAEGPRHVEGTFTWTAAAQVILDAMTGAIDA